MSKIRGVGNLNAMRVIHKATPNKIEQALNEMNQQGYKLVTMFSSSRRVMLLLQVDNVTMIFEKA